MSFYNKEISGWNVALRFTLNYIKQVTGVNINLPEKLTVTQLVKKFPSFMDSEGSLRVHKIPPPVQILSHMNPFNPLTLRSLEISFNIILHSTPIFQGWCHPFGISDQNFVLTFHLCQGYHLPLHIYKHTVNSIN